MATSVHPSAGGPSHYASASLYVGDLAPEVNEGQLFDVFNSLGPVASIRVCRNTQTRRSLGYAYVNFHRVEDAEKALDTMNFKVISGRPCRIMWSHRDPSLRRSNLGNVFVKNLAKSIDNKTLYDQFSIFGNILSCKVSTNEKGESLGYGFVHYETEEAARKAIDKANDKDVANERINVTAFKSKRERGVGHFTNLYVKNLPKDFSEAKLRELFGQFGEIQSALCIMDKDHKDACKGFGFVNYETHEAALAAINNLNDTKLSSSDEKKLYVGRAQKKDERQKELRDKFEQLKAERQKQYQGVNLYVKNLSDDIDDGRLMQEFKQFGEIHSAKVMQDAKTGKSRGFGFVCFTTPEDATKALVAMHNHPLDGKPLYVAIAQRKEERRARFESLWQARAKSGGVQPPMYPPQAIFGPQMPRMMYPGMPPAAWGGQPMGPMMSRPAYQLMPVPGGPGGPGNRQGPGPRRGGGRGRQNQQMNMQRGGQQQQGFKYTENVRNPMQQQDHPQSMHHAPQHSAQQDQIQPPNTSPERMSVQELIKFLSSAPAETAKQVIGERLYPLVLAEQPDQAAKITGMLLEMDNGELIHLLESNDALKEKIQEALVVLEHHQPDEQPEAEEDTNTGA